LRVEALDLGAEAFDGVFDRHGDAGEDGCVFFYILASFGFSQLLNQVEEVIRGIGLESHHKLVVVNTETIGRVQFDGRIFVADKNMLVHDSLTGELGQQVPFARLDEGVNK